MYSKSQHNLELKEESWILCKTPLILKKHSLSHKIESWSISSIAKPLKSTMMLIWNPVLWPNRKNRFVELRKTWALWFFQLLQRAGPFLNSKAITITIFLDLLSVLTLRLVRSKKSKRKKRKLCKRWKARVGSSIKKKNEVFDYFITLMINSLYGFFYPIFLFRLFIDFDLMWMNTINCINGILKDCKWS